jgi:hypothetical protein
MSTTPQRYDVVIKRIEPRRNYGFRYEAIVYWDRANGMGDIAWAVTLWGARREARKLIKGHGLPKEQKITVEEYRV